MTMMVTTRGNGQSSGSQRDPVVMGQIGCRFSLLETMIECGSLCDETLHVLCCHEVKLFRSHPRWLQVHPSCPLPFRLPSRFPSLQA